MQCVTSHLHNFDCDTTIHTLFLALMKYIRPINNGLCNNMLPIINQSTFGHNGRIDDMSDMCFNLASILASDYCFLFLTHQRFCFVTDSSSIISLRYCIICSIMLTFCSSRIFLTKPCTICAIVIVNLCLFSPVKMCSWGHATLFCIVTSMGPLLFYFNLLLESLPSAWGYPNLAKHLSIVFYIFR